MTREQRITQWRKNPTVEKMMDICEHWGYVCDRAWIESYGWLTLGIYPKDRSFHSFYPEIYYDWNSKNLHDVAYKIQTTSYGALSQPEFKKMMHCWDQALRMVEDLQRLDLSTLPHLPDKFDNYDGAD